MNRLLEKDLQLYIGEQGGAEKILYFGQKSTPAIRVYLDFWPSSYHCTLVPDHRDSLIFKEEFWTSIQHDGKEFALFTGSGPAKDTEDNTLGRAGDRESGLPRPGKSDQKNRAVPAGIANYLTDWKVYHFHDTSASAKVKMMNKLYDNDFLRPNAENLAAFLFSIQNTLEYEKIVRTIQRVAPFFQGFILQPEKINPDYIRLRWKHKGTDSYFDANDLSDGTLRFVCLTTLLLQPELPSLILLDEPELGLHPYAMHLLAGMIRSASAETQVIASTQSVTLANQFDWQDLVIVERQDNASVFRRLKEDELKIWLEEYRIGDLWEKNLLGGTPE
ncbi:MAG: AAA family ATPase [Candidatus Competibacteraceae bacterium]|nr:AAA family ATPase [Candidatus Competibacteraceae bacterium]